MVPANHFIPSLWTTDRTQRPEHHEYCQAAPNSSLAMGAPAKRQSDSGTAEITRSTVQLGPSGCIGARNVLALCSMRARALGMEADKGTTLCGKVLQKIRNGGKLPPMSNSYLSHVNRMLIVATTVSSRSKAARKNFHEFPV
jgi:hypothetical protein